MKHMKTELKELSFQSNEYNDEAISLTKKYLWDCFKANYFNQKEDLEVFIKAYLQNDYLQDDYLQNGNGLKLSGVDISDEAWKFFRQNPEEFLHSIAFYLQKDLNNFPYAPRGKVKIDVKNGLIDMKFVYDKERAIKDSLFYILLGEVPSIFGLIHNFQNKFIYDKEFILRNFDNLLAVLKNNTDKSLKDILIENGYLQELYPVGKVNVNLLDLIIYFLYDTEMINQYELLKQFMEILQIEDNLQKSFLELINENFPNKNLKDFLNELQMQFLLLFRNLGNNVF